VWKNSDILLQVSTPLINSIPPVAADPPDEAIYPTPTPTPT